MFKKIYPFLIVIFIIFFYSCKTAQISETSANEENNKSEKRFYKHYSKKLGIELSGKEDKCFIKEIAEWLGTPYHFGGCSKSGTDCSGFVYTVYKNIFNIFLYRQAEEMVKNTKPVEKINLKTSDLIFFKTSGDKISHVGIYIENNKFVHASSAKGVIISDLNEPYFIEHYYCAGRVKKNE